MSTSVLVSLLTAQVLGMSLFFTEAYPDAMVPLIQMALAAALASAVIFFCIDMLGRAVEAAAASQVGAIPAADVVVAASAEQARTSSIRRPGI